MSIILETLNILAARFTVPFFAASQGMKLCIKVQCIFHFAGYDSAALLHRSHGQCDFPWMQAVWHGNFPIVLSGYFCNIFAICNACILITMFNVLQPSSPFSLVLFSPCIYHHSLHPTSSHIVHSSLPHLSHCFLSCPLSCAFNNLSIIYKATLYMSVPNVCV